MSVPFHETRMGHRVFTRDLPALVTALQEIAKELAALNEALREKEGGRASEEGD